MITPPPDNVLTQTLDAALPAVRTADAPLVSQSLATIGAVLAGLRRGQSPAEWRETIAACRRHPIGQWLLDDPLTRRSFTRPRGYAGDAELLDIIYGRSWQGLAPEPTRVGAALFAHTIECRAPSAVRARKDFLARQIEAACARQQLPHVLSVACGHLRELGECEAFLGGRTGRFVGLDQDELSLREVARSLPAGAVEAVPGSIKLLFGGALAREKFDLIYSAGLYDYLDADLGARLTRRMFEMLRPGGRLLIANFSAVSDQGYMEAFMDWHLIYRDPPAMLALAGTIHADLACSPRVFPDETGAVLYLELERAS